MTDVVRIGFVGAGGNTTKRHIPGFKAIDGVKLVSVANRTRESSQRVADEFGISTVYDGWQDLIAADDTDAICIGTWPNMHHPLVLASLDADKHVLCEARMAMNSAEAWDMLAAGREQPDLVKQIVPSPFTLWADNTVKELISNGFMGDLLSVDVALSKGFVDHDAAYSWRDDRDLSGNNVLWTGIFYEILMGLIGPATSVQAATIPTPAPKAAIRNASMSNSRATRARPAPNAARRPSSSRRETVRASIRLPTLAQAIRSTRPTAPSNSSNRPCQGPSIQARNEPATIPSCSSSLAS